MSSLACDLRTYDYSPKAALPRPVLRAGYQVTADSSAAHFSRNNQPADFGTRFRLQMTANADIDPANHGSGHAGDIDDMICESRKRLDTLLHFGRRDLIAKIFTQLGSRLGVVGTDFARE